MNSISLFAKGYDMTDRDAYLNEKLEQISLWIDELSRLDALSREADEDIRMKFEIQITELHQNLKELQAIFLEFEVLSAESRNKFRNLVERNWTELEDGFKRSVSHYEDLCRARTGE
jgi:hypothetical protein